MFRLRCGKYSWAATEPGRRVSEHHVRDAEAAESVDHGAATPTKSGMQQNQQMVAAMLRRMDLEEERRTKAEEKVVEAAEAARKAAL